MSRIKVISESGLFNGLREKKEECINIRMSDLNQKKGLKIVGLSNAQVVRLLIDAKSENEQNLIEYLNSIYANNPNIELHINLEFDKYFEYAKHIMSRVKFGEKSITLWPDNELKDRSYLDLTNLPCNTIIPIQYVMWHNSIEKADSNYLYFLRKDNEVKDGSLPFSPYFTYKENGVVDCFDSSLYNLKEALFLKNTVLRILQTDLKDLVDCSLAPDQKILVIMKYFVDNFVYTEEPKLQNGKITFHNTKFPYYGANTLINKQGVCEGIAEAFMMLLNNPLIGIDCRCRVGLAWSDRPDSGHAWNIVRLVDEKDHTARWFYMDPTWNVNENNYYAWSFLKADAMSERKIYDCANPTYESYDNIELNERAMKHRLNDALARLEKARNGIKQIRVIYSLEEIVKNAKIHLHL